MSETPKRVREGLVVRKFRLGEEPPDDIRDYTTPSQRLAMVWELSRRMWELQGSPPCPYTRSTMPIRVFRRDASGGDKDPADDAGLGPLG